LILQKNGGWVGIGKTTATSMLDVNGNVTANTFNATSDMRIKSNIIDINGTLALDTLRKIEPKQYNYINNNTKTWGFIAQQVDGVLDYTTTKSINYVPNINEIANITNGNIVTLINKDTSVFAGSENGPVKVKFINSKSSDIIRVIDKITDNERFSITVPLSVSDYSNNQIFVYGQEVDDFMSINYNTIFTVATAAIKEIDRELQYTKQIVQDQSSVIQSLQTEINNLNTQVSALSSRLDAAGF
jgi:hypothetical protein